MAIRLPSSDLIGAFDRLDTTRLPKPVPIHKLVRQFGVTCKTSPYDLRF